MYNSNKTIYIINQYSGTSDSGNAGRSYYFAKELARNGYKVYLITASYTHLMKKQPIANENFTIQPVNDLKIVWVKVPEYTGAHDKKRVLNWFLFSQKIKKLPKILKNKPNTIIYSAPSLVGYLGAQKLAKKYQAKLILDIRDIWPLTLIQIGKISPAHPFIRLLSFIEKKAYLNSDVVVSNLKYAVNHMKSLGMNPDKFTWIPNGVDLNEVTNPMALPNDYLAQFPKNKFIVGYTGTFGLANDIHTLVAAAKLIQEKDIDISFVLIGYGREIEALKQEIHSSKLENIVLLSAISKTQVQTALSHFDALWVGAKKNNLYDFGVSPNKLFEYMFAQKPIIYSIESGEFKPITNHNCGLQTLAENPQDLADTILKLKQLPANKRKQMGENGLRAVLEHYTYQSLTKQLEQLL